MVRMPCGGWALEGVNGPGCCFFFSPQAEVPIRAPFLHSLLPSPTVNLPLYDPYLSLFFSKMAVMCELHQIMKELKVVSDRASQAEPIAATARADPAPLPPEMLTSSLDEPMVAEGPGRATPKKSGARTLRGISGGSNNAAAGPTHKSKPSPRKSKPINEGDKDANRTGLGATNAGDAIAGSTSIDDSPPPPPPSDSPSQSASSIPPPPPPSDSQPQSSASSPVPPPPIESSDSPPPPPPESESSPPPSISSATTSMEHNDVATYVSNHLDRDSRSSKKKDANNGQTAVKAAPPANAPSPRKSSANAQAPAQAPAAKVLPTGTAKAAAAAAPKLQVHELPHTFVKITKDTIEETPPMETSALSRLLGPSDVEVWVPGAKATFAVRILPSATMAQLVQQAVKAHNASLQKGERPLETNPDAYNVRVATPDGKVDDLFGVLAKKGTLDQWAEVAFILVENPNYKPNGNASASGDKHSDKGSASPPAVPTGAPATTTSEKLTIRVTLPTGAYHTVLADPSMKLGKLLTLICEKRKMIASHYTLTTLSKEYISTATRLSDLKELHLVLESKQAETPLGPPSAEELFYTDNVAAQYKLYQNIIFHVRNRKKFNLGTAKTETVSLGIDGTTFTINFPKKTGAGTTFSYAISDLKSVSRTEEFMINVETIKEKDKLVFECSNATAALEIQTKIATLIDMHSSDIKD